MRVYNYGLGIRRYSRRDLRIYYNIDVYVFVYIGIDLGIYCRL